MKYKIKNSLLKLFNKIFYKKYKLYLAIGSEECMIEYYRTPFWTNEKPNLKLFFSNKFTSWHVWVWLVYSNGGRCGLGTTVVDTIFPKRKIRDFFRNRNENNIRIHK